MLEKRLIFVSHLSSKGIGQIAHVLAQILLVSMTPEELRQHVAELASLHLDQTCNKNIQTYSSSSNSSSSSDRVVSL